MDLKNYLSLEMDEISYGYGYHESLLIKHFAMKPYFVLNGNIIAHLKVAR